MNLQRWTWVAAILMVCTAASAGASEVRDLSMATNEEGATAPATDADHALSPGGTRVQVNFGQDANRATITFSPSQSNSVEWQAKLSTPLNKDDAETSLVELGGLANGTKAELDLNYSWFSDRNGSAAQALGACAHIHELLRPYNDLPDRVSEGLKTEGYCDKDMVQEAYLRSSDRVPLKEFTDALFGGRPYLIRMGANVTAGYRNYAFLDATFKNASVHKTGVQVGLNASLTDVVHLWSVVGSLQRERAYESSDDLVRLCTPVDGTPAERCKEGFLGPPTRSNTTIGSLEWRWQPNRKLALSVRGSYESKGDVTAISVPIYFLSNADGSLRGGIKFGWRSDTKDAQAGIFVSSGFSGF